MRLLIADGSDRVRKTLIRYLELEKYFDTVFEANNVTSAITTMQYTKVEVVIVDIQLSGQSGLELVNYCSSQYHKPLIIVCSNYGMPEYKKIYEKYSIDHFFDKSSDMLEFKKFIKELANDNHKNSRQPVFKRKHIQ